MALTIVWDAIPGAEEYEVFRATAKFDLANLPTDKVTVPGDTNSHEYLDVTRQTIYWFVVRTVDADGNDVYGEIFNVGYFPESGPGPTTLLRGDWMFGFFGVVDPSELGQYTDIYSELIKAGIADPINASAKVIDYFMKCIVNGKIVFIPNVSYQSTGLITLSAEMEKHGFAGPDFDGETAPEIKLNNYDYRHRLPYGSISKPTKDPVMLDPLSDDALLSELGLIGALFVNPAETGFAKNPSTQKQPEVHARLFDNANLLSEFIGLHRPSDVAATTATAGTSWTTGIYGNVGNFTWSSTANVNYLPILELLF